VNGLQATTPATHQLRALARPIDPRPVMAPATTGAALPVETWRTVAASETTRPSPPPLTPALDPANAGFTVRVEWAGVCRLCAAPIWSSVSPGRTVPRLCPPCREAELAAGPPVGPPIFRPWMVWRNGPPEVPGTGRKPTVKGEIAGCNGRPLSDPHLARESETGFVTSAIPRVGPRRGGRPRVHRDNAARQRAYRLRLPRPKECQWGAATSKGARPGRRRVHRPRLGGRARNASAAP
jgi:hypothetical protein